MYIYIYEYINWHLSGVCVELFWSEIDLGYGHFFFTKHSCENTQLLGQNETPRGWGFPVKGAGHHLINRDLYSRYKDSDYGDGHAAYNMINKVWQGHTHIDHRIINHTILLEGFLFFATPQLPHNHGCGPWIGKLPQELSNLVWCFATLAFSLGTAGQTASGWVRWLGKVAG